MTQTDKQPTCEERVSSNWQSRRLDLGVLFGSPTDAEKDVFVTAQGYDFDPDSEDALDEALMEARSYYGLSFDYVEPNTFDDQPNGYFRYQLSYGGPSDEIRFYADIDAKLYKAEYWFLDWFDGASIDVTADEMAKAVFDDFAELGAITVAFVE